MIIELEPWEIKLLRAGLGQLKKRAEKNKKRTPNFIPEHGHNNVNDSRLKGIRTLMERLQYNDMENRELGYFCKLANQKERAYVRQQLHQLTLSRDISLNRIAEMAGISKTSLYDMYNIDRQHVRNRRTMFNKLYQAFWEIKPFNQDVKSGIDQ